MGGGQAGYNWRTGAFVFGVETDFDGTTLSRSRSVIGPSFVEPVFGLNDFFTADGSVKLDWLPARPAAALATLSSRTIASSSTARAASPTAGASSHLIAFDAVHGFDFSSSGGGSSRVGWTIGGGVEYAFTNNWIIGVAEYLYYDLGSRHLNIVPNTAASGRLGSGRLLPNEDQLYRARCQRSAPGSATSSDPRSGGLEYAGGKAYAFSLFCGGLKFKDRAFRQVARALGAVGARPPIWIAHYRACLATPFRQPARRRIIKGMHLAGLPGMTT